MQRSIRKLMRFIPFFVTQTSFFGSVLGRVFVLGQHLSKSSRTRETTEYERTSNPNSLSGWSSAFSNAFRRSMRAGKSKAPILRSTSCRLPEQVSDVGNENVRPPVDRAVEMEGLNPEKLQKVKKAADNSEMEGESPRIPIIKLAEMSLSESWETENDDFYGLQGLLRVLG